MRQMWKLSRCLQKREARHNGEGGMITVEAVLSLVPFIIVVLGIISFINIFMVHNRIQFAIQQMGNELSCYTYFYEALGIRAADKELGEEEDKQTQSVDKALEDVGKFLTAMGELEDSYNEEDKTFQVDQQAVNAFKNAWETGEAAAGDVKGLLADPKGTLRGFIYLALEMGEEKGKALLLDLISSGMIDSYLESSALKNGVGLGMTSDQYLRYFGVKNGKAGLDFGKSSLFSKNASSENLKYRMIDIVVEYDIEVYILKLFLKDPTIHVVQRCVVPAWLDGDGQKYGSD